MSFAVNDLLQTACEDLNLADGPISGELASKAENCLNRAITALNADNYISLSKMTLDLTAAGNVYFRKMEEGETPPSNTINMEPPDSVDGVSRKLGIRWMRLRPSNKQFMDSVNTYSLPQLWCYGVESEVAPSGTPRQVGVVRLNGSCPTELRIYLCSQLPKYRLGDFIYLSSLYYNLILYKTEELLCDMAKTYSYKEGVAVQLGIAMKAVDNNHLNNEPLNNDLGDVGSYLDPFYNMIGGVGM